MSFGNKLKILRVSHRLDQESISKKLSISQPVYSRYENDEKEVNEHSTIVQRVAEEFNVTPQWLLNSEQKNVLNEEAAPYRPGNETAYHIPKEFFDAFLQQQEMTNRLLNLLDRGGIS